MKIFVLILLLSLTGCTNFPKEKIIVDEDGYEYVSIIDLIANKSRYYNKKVKVKGVLRLMFEEDSIYLNKESFEHRVYKNSLYLGLSKKLRARYTLMKHDLGGDYVEVKGKFIEEKGMWGLFSGTILAEKIELYPDKTITEKDIEEIFKVEQ